MRAKKGGGDDDPSMAVVTYRLMASWSVADDCRLVIDRVSSSWEYTWGGNTSNRVSLTQLVMRHIVRISEIKCGLRLQLAMQTTRHF